MNGVDVSLSTGDSFEIPVQNIYSLTNISDTKTAKLYFTLVKQQQQIDVDQQQPWTTNVEAFSITTIV